MKIKMAIIMILSEQDENLSFLPIWIGGALSLVIVSLGLILGYIILRYPHSKVTELLGTLIG